MKKSSGLVLGVGLILISTLVFFTGNNSSSPNKEEKEEIHYVMIETSGGEPVCSPEMVKKDKLYSDTATFKTRELCENKDFSFRVATYKDKKAAEKSEADKKEKEEAKFKEKRYNELVKKFRVKNDKIENNSFYEHKSNLRTSYGYTLVREDEVRIYIGKSGSQKWLWFYAKYDAESWLFIDSFMLYVDGENYSRVLQAGDIGRGNYTKIWEIIQIAAEGDLLNFIHKIVDSKESIIRYKGKYNSDKTISEREKKAMKETLELFELM